jgi:hypothetical protein
VVWSFIYLALRRVLGLLVLRGRSQRSKDLELVVLRHEVQILRRQVRRLELQPADRGFLAAASQVLDRRRWGSLVVAPATLLGWHRRPPDPVAGEHRLLRARRSDRGGSGGVLPLRISIGYLVGRKAALRCVLSDWG